MMTDPVEIRAAIDEGRALVTEIVKQAPELIRLHSLTTVELYQQLGGRLAGAALRTITKAFIELLEKFNRLIKDKDPVGALAALPLPEDPAERAKVLEAIATAREAEAVIRSSEELLKRALEEKLRREFPSLFEDAATPQAELARSSIDWDAVISVLEAHRAEVSVVTNAAFDAYSDAVATAIETGHFSAAGIGKSIKASAKESLLSIGQQAMGKGMFETGLALKGYASGDSEGGQKHMSAAGKHFAVAAMTGAGAGLLGSKGGGGGSGDKSSKGAAEKPAGIAPSGSGGGSSGKGGVIQHLRIIGNPSDADIATTKNKIANKARQ